MRRLLILASVVSLGFGPLIFGQLSVSAQEGEEIESGDFDVNWNDFTRWEGVGRPQAVEQASRQGGRVVPVVETLQQFEVFFAIEYAAAPVVENAEFMLVVVEEGSFALDLTPEGVAPSGPQSFVVHPDDGASIPTLRRLEPAETEPYYEPTGDVVLGADGQPCMSMCVIPVATIVEVKPGDKIVAREGAVCLWCLLNTTPGEGNERGLLLVSPVLPASAQPDQFSWVQFWDESVHTATPVAETAPVAVGWAFNPPTSCH